MDGDHHIAVLVAIECEDCGTYTEKALVWLENARSMPCSGCGAKVDLLTAQNRMIIEGLLKCDSRARTSGQRVRDPDTRLNDGQRRTRD